MNSTLSDIVKKIPDFEEFVAQADKIRTLALGKLLLENSIKTKESEIYIVATTDPKYLVGGKTPAISFIKSAYEFTGLDGELVASRDSLSKLTTDLEYERQVMSVYKDMVSVFQTLSANERGTGF